jgi:hypothetical protein
VNTGLGYSFQTIDPRSITGGSFFGVAQQLMGDEGLETPGPRAL